MEMTQEVHGLEMVEVKVSILNFKFPTPKHFTSSTPALFSGFTALHIG